jgi:hypothetical protein
VTEVRNYIPGEWLPERLRTTFESCAGTDPRWIFVILRNEKPVGILVLAPAHAYLIMLRVIMDYESGAEVNDLRTLLKKSAIVCRERGFMGYATWLDPTSVEERQLMGIFLRTGGKQLMNPQVLCCGRL